MSARREVRLGIAVIALPLLGACAGTRATVRPTEGAMQAQPRGAPREAERPVVTPERDPLPSVRQLAVRGPLICPGLPEAGGGETRAGEPPVALTTGDGDGCVRVTFAASRPVRAILEDDHGLQRAATTRAATTGELAERGPVCVRRGDRLRVRFEGDAGGDRARVRWAAWSSR